MSSRRKYYVAMIDDTDEVDQFWFDLDKIYELDPEESHYEFRYALNDIIDDVLDLKNGESMYFQPDRQDINSKGIIKRIQ